MKIIYTLVRTLGLIAGVRIVYILLMQIIAILSLKKIAAIRPS